MGESVKWKKGTLLNVDLPEAIKVPFQVEVYRNGNLYFKSSMDNEKIEIKEKGVYRIVVKIRPNLPLPDSERWFGWIYTNNFYLK